MRILHTSDWHLGSRLYDFDRTDELFSQVERVCRIAKDNAVDVLLVVGDIFERMQRDRLNNTTQRLAKMLAPLVHEGMRVILVPGNHDFRDHFQMMRALLELELGATERLRVVRGYDEFEWDGVQFRILPYPEPELLERNRPSVAEADLDRRNFSLSNILCELLRKATSTLDPAKPSVLAAHLLIKGVTTPSQKELGYNEDICIGSENLPTNVSYIALGHIHQRQQIRHSIPCWYCGSLDRMDFGERNDDKFVQLVDIPDSGVAKIREVSLPVAHFDDIHVTSSDLESFAEKYRDREKAYVHITIDLAPEDDSIRLQRRARDLFPRCLDVRFAGAYAPVINAAAPENPRDYETTVSNYIEQKYKDDPDLPDLQQLAQQLILEAYGALTQHQA